MSVAVPNEARTPAADLVNEPLVAEDGTVEVDDNDSAYDSASQSDYTSVTSSIYKGIFEHGRRYQALNEGATWGPADERQFESMALCHVVYRLLDNGQENPLFRSPISENATRILDIGCGEGSWPIDVADHFPNTTVHGVDLFPPPQTWVPPNCFLEVDDLSKPWTWTEKFDLIHIRHLLGSFTDEGWKELYKSAYANLKPGGWIEQLETSVVFQSADGSIPPSSTMGKWGQMFVDCGQRSGRRLDIETTMRRDIEGANFVNVHEKHSKIPLGTWPKHPVMKEAGRLRLKEFLEGMEGYSLFLLTHFGEPEPWSPEQVQILLMEMRKDLSNKNYHPYGALRRVWAQKPFDDEATTATAAD